MGAPHQQADEETLVALAVEGDFDAFEVLVEAYDDRMRAVAYRCLGSSRLMDDALQVAYVKAFKNLGSFRYEAKFSTWLHRIVVNACHDVRSRPELTNEVALPDMLHLGTNTMEENIIQSDELAQALQNVPFDQRVVLVLVDAQGLSYDEAAEILRVQNGTIASRLHRGRANLRTALLASREDRYG